MNRYLTLDPGPPKPADRYYGRVDSVEAIDNQRSESLIQLDAVAADNFDRTQFRDRPLTDDADRLPIAVLEFSTLNVPTQVLNNLPQMVQAGRWLQVRQVPQGSASVEVDYYPGLFSDGVTLSSEIVPVDEKLAMKLSTAFSMDDLADATQRQIADLLNQVPEPDFISVFDVGQGNLNALWESNGGAALYFDFGGGVTANKRTYPKKPMTPCLNGDAPVVLSHWDWDHWSSAGRFPKVLEHHWIVPRCTDPGAHHRALAWELHRRGHLHIWPTGMKDYAGAYFRVERCTGSGRNDSGLAMIVHGQGGPDFAREVLLTGDAAYDCIPAVKSKTRFGALVASHHGAVVNSISEAQPSAGGAALVYSVGNGNCFCHPRLHAELEYLQSGWRPNDTYSTSQRVRNRPTAIAIRLSASPVDTGCGDCTPKLIC
jgi:hypothetical protein